ncbi:MAG: hypothetical protein AAGF93_01540 [Cyanobacteria bacterium P01_H01_bin.105]
MAGKSLTQRLADLQQKKANLDAQIKQIEQEESQRLRREKHERARIIGMAMLRLVEKGNWTEDKLMRLVAPFVISGKERRFLGLEVSAPSRKRSSSSKSSTPSSKSPAAKSTAAETIGTASKVLQTAAKRRLPEVTTEKDILGEFNL